MSEYGESAGIDEFLSDTSVVVILKSSESGSFFMVSARVIC